MFIAYFLLFILFNGKLTLEIALFGAVFAAVLYAFSCKYLGYSFQKDADLFRKVPDGIRYLIMLAVEIVKASLTVIRMVLTPGFEPKPQLAQFHSGLRDEGHRVVLADSITLTPGTITCELSEDLFTVHCLDVAQYEGIEHSSFAQALTEIEERERQRQEAVEAEKREQAASVPETAVEASDGAIPDAELTGDSGAVDEKEGQQE